MCSQPSASIASAVAAGRRGSPASRCSRGPAPRRRRRCAPRRPSQGRPAVVAMSSNGVAGAGERHGAGLGEAVAGHQRLERKFVVHPADRVRPGCRPHRSRRPAAWPACPCPATASSEWYSVGGPGSIVIRSPLNQFHDRSTSKTATGSIVAPRMKRRDQARLVAEGVEERVDHQVAVALAQIGQSRTTPRTSAASGGDSSSRPWACPSCPR